jgi:hypothetical protein
MIRLQRACAHCHTVAWRCHTVRMILHTRVRVVSRRSPSNDPDLVIDAHGGHPHAFHSDIYYPCMTGCARGNACHGVPSPVASLESATSRHRRSVACVAVTGFRSTPSCRLSIASRTAGTFKHVWWRCEATWATVGELPTPSLYFFPIARRTNSELFACHLALHTTGALDPPPPPPTHTHTHHHTHTHTRT